MGKCCIEILRAAGPVGGQDVRVSLPRHLRVKGWRASRDAGGIQGAGARVLAHGHHAESRQIQGRIFKFSN
jgi:hypothetical protein